ncbi:MAG: hypothetical protein KBF99_00580 [Leptospiraceae bacterium]|nr:hypothetical protein [Leptospiraceae bacterium]MBK7058559.1 hypothetical protein [Leptospiraceae bacterium]MBP9161637.1 hypothetical protein [Leptospiraceae bacterium]
MEERAITLNLEREKRINREGHEEREEMAGFLDKILRGLRALRGEKSLSY